MNLFNVETNKRYKKQYGVRTYFVSYKHGAEGEKGGPRARREDKSLNSRDKHMWGHFMMEVTFKHMFLVKAYHFIDLICVQIYVWSRLLIQMLVEHVLC